jgi:hypothetical protein
MSGFVAERDTGVFIFLIVLQEYLAATHPMHRMILSQKFCIQSSIWRGHPVGGQPPCM